MWCGNMYSPVIDSDYNQMYIRFVSNNVTNALHRYYMKYMILSDGEYSYIQLYFDVEYNYNYLFTRYTMQAFFHVNIH